MTALKFSPILALILLTFAACGDDDSPEPAASATFRVTIENVLPASSYLASGSTNFLAPGESQVISFHAGKGSYLSFATMFVQSNDLFFAFGETGLELYNATGNARTGDVTAEVDLWDAGTEVNEAPGTGPNQAPRQTGPNTGPAENGNVQLVNDGFTYPANGDVIRLTLAHDGGTMFTFTIENISGSASLATPFALGAWVVHGGGMPLFAVGQTASAGLEGIAEDGANELTVNELAAATGYTSPFAPGVWAVHASTVAPIFANGSPDAGQGLEALAEDGDPAALNTSLTGATGIRSNGVFNTPEGAGAPGPLLPGGTYTFTVDAEDGDNLSLATMLVHTNDLFFAFGQTGIQLFENGAPVNGNVTAQVQLWDAGTEVNEYPGAGNNQPARGGGNSGPTENGTVRTVNDGFTYPSVASAIRLSIEAMQ